MLTPCMKFSLLAGIIQAIAIQPRHLFLEHGFPHFVLRYSSSVGLSFRNTLVKSNETTFMQVWVKYAQSPRICHVHRKKRLHPTVTVIVLPCRHFGSDFYHARTQSLSLLGLYNIITVNIVFFRTCWGINRPSGWLVSHYTGPFDSFSQ